MRVLVCGDRHWTDQKLIEKELEAFFGKPRKLRIIEGEAPGADTLARRVAEKRGIPYEPYPADWRRYGRAAGPIRNQLMLDEGKPDVVLAFHDDLDNSKGTKDMIRRAEKAGIKVKKIRH